METLMLLFPLIFTNNLLMSFVKFLAGNAKRTVWLRAILLIFSGTGVIATSALSGNDIDFNQLSDIGKLILETTALWVASHYSYRVIKEA